MNIPAHWKKSEDGKSIARDFKFKDFEEAWVFMNHVAALAEAHDHHPDWSNSFNKVHISLTSHDVKALTDRDVALAEAINAIQ